MSEVEFRCRATDAVLRVAMADSDVHAWWRANWAITRFVDGTVVPRLIEGLSCGNPVIAWNCAVTLSLFSVADGVVLLHDGLDAEGWQQWEAVNALGRVWNESTVSLLISVLQHGEENVRKETALSLGQIGGAVALAALLDALANDASFEVRWRAAMVIGSMGGQGTVADLEPIRAQESHPFVLQHIDQAMQMLESAY